MIRRFGPRLGRVGTLALPHHGSKESFNALLLTACDGYRPVCSASVAEVNGYGHPHMDVILKLSANGNHVVIVTERESSRWTEAGMCMV